MSFELTSNHEQTSNRREKMEQEIADFKVEVMKKFSDQDQISIFEALEFMLKIHLPQKDRADGHPFASHPLAVARQVMEFHDDPELVIAALTHDSVEDQADRVFIERLKRKEFNPDSIPLEISEELKEKYHRIFSSWAFREIEDLFGSKVKYYTENMTNHDFNSLAEGLSLEGEAKQNFVNKLYAAHVEDIISDPKLFTLKLADLSTNIDLHTLDKDSLKYKKLKRKYKSVIETIIDRLHTLPGDHPLYNNREEILSRLNKIYLEQYSN